MAFNIKTVPSATDIWSFPALMMGPTAAMALPPQMAVPELIKYPVFLSTFSFLAIQLPRNKVPATETMVKSMPSFPEASACCKFIPKPRPITDPCNRYLDIFLLNLG